MQTGYVPMKNQKQRKFKPEGENFKRRKPDYSELRKAKRGE